MSYIINGPTTIGDTGSINTFNGDITLTDIGVTRGDLFTVVTGGNLSAIAVGTAGQVLTSDGTDPGWASATAGSVGEGFAAFLTISNTGIASTPTTIGTALEPWSTAGTFGYANFTVSGDTFVVTTGIFTSTSGGNYLVSYNIDYTNTVNNGTRTISLYDGTSNVLTRSYQPAGNNSVNKYVSISVQITLSATDTLELQMSTSSGTVDIIGGSPLSNTTFSIVKLD